MSLTLYDATESSSPSVLGLVGIGAIPQDMTATAPATELDVSRQQSLYEMIGRRAAIPQHYSLVADCMRYALLGEAFGQEQLYAVGVPFGTNDANTALRIKAEPPTTFRRDKVAKAIMGLDQIRTLALLSQIGDLSKWTVAQDADTLLALENAKSDTVKFISKLPAEIQTPTVFTAEDGEIVLEWKQGSSHAVVDFQGDGFFGYALLSEGRFIPGKHEGDLSQSTLPEDLIQYLKPSSPNERRFG